MHNYLRAIGFNQLRTNTDVDNFIFNEVVCEKNKTAEFAAEGGSMIREYRLKVGEGIGVCAITESFRSGRQNMSYFPYLNNPDVSTKEICIVERYTEKESFAGLTDEYKIGLSLIFFINNPCAYRQLPEAGKVTEFRGTCLSAFCNAGTVLLPIQTFEMEDEVLKKKQEEETLIEKAKNGDEEAIETLTVADMDAYSQVSKRIQNEDLYSIVESSFIPCGVECDLYSVLGEITEVRTAVNTYTDDKIFKLKIISNEIEFRLAIREEDLLGVPEKGRRFKGRIWLQGKVDFTNPVRHAAGESM